MASPSILHFSAKPSLFRMEVSPRAILFIIGFLVACIFVIFPAKIAIGRGKKEIPLDFSTVPIAVVVVLFLTTSIPWVVVIRGILGVQTPDWAKDPSNSSYLVPYTVIILFMTLAYVCMSAEHTKAFIVIANKFSKTALSSSNPGIIGLSLFSLLAAIFTLVTSNDIVILTLTPIILQFSKKTDSRLLLSLLLAEFCSANSYSAGLLSGNPSNIILSSVFKIDFSTYMKYLLLPAIVSGLAVYVYCFVLAKHSTRIQSAPATKDIELQLTTKSESKDASNMMGNEHDEKSMAVKAVDVKKESEGNPDSATEEKDVDTFNANMKVSLALLLLLFILFLSSTPIQNRWPVIEFWHIAVFMFILTLIKDFIFYRHNLHTIADIVKTLPWKVPLFLLAMFILVETASYYHFTSSIAQFLANTCISPVLRMGDLVTALFFNVLTCIACIIFNNLPATIFVTRILSEPAVKDLLGDRLYLATFSVAAGTNFGACILPHGSLAGLMWSGFVHDKDVLKRVWKHGSLVCLVLVVVCSLLLCFMQRILCSVSSTNSLYTFTVFVEDFFSTPFLVLDFLLLPFTPPTAFAVRVVLMSRNTTTAMMMITTTTRSTIMTTGMQKPVAFCHSPSFLPSKHALFCVPT